MERRRRLIVAVLVVIAAAMGAFYERAQQPQAAPEEQVVANYTDLISSGATTNALETLNTLSIKGRAPRTGYSRAQFGGDWPEFGLCDLRNQILRRDMTNVQTVSAEDCTVISGTLNDPYTGQIIQFQRGLETSREVEIDHVVALSDAWQKGAQNLTEAQRVAFANDPLNLLAVSGPANAQKSDSDAASWLPPNKDYRCRYVARQVVVKAKHKLWVTEAEKESLQTVLRSCNW